MPSDDFFVPYNHSKTAKWFRQGSGASPASRDPLQPHAPINEMNTAVEGDRDNLQGCPSLPGAAPHKSLRKPPRRNACLSKLWTCWTTLQVDHMTTAACCVRSTAHLTAFLKISPIKQEPRLHQPAGTVQLEGGGREQWAKRPLTRLPVVRCFALCQPSVVGRSLRA